MVKGGSRRSPEARRSGTRPAYVDPAVHHFVGSMEMWNLGAERRIRAAVASGDPRAPAAVPVATRCRRLARRPASHTRSTLKIGDRPRLAADSAHIERILLGQ